MNEKTPTSLLIKTGNLFSLILTLAKTDFKLRYHGSVLGFVWAFLKPLFIFLILNFVFSNLFSNGVPNFSIKLLLGIVLFTFFSEGTMSGMLALVSKSHILKKIYIKKWIIVISSTLHIFLSFLINLIIVGIFMIANSVIPTLFDIMWFFIYVIELYLIILSFSFITSAIYVKIRDLNQIWEVLLTILFYASPIIYPLSIIPEKYHIYMFLNPLTFLIEHSKSVLIDSNFSSLDKNFWMIGISIVILFLSMLIFKKFSRNINEKL